MPIDPRTFDAVLAAAKTALDESEAFDPDSVTAGRAAWLNVRRAIHRDHPNQYGNPDDNATPDEIAVADALIVAAINAAA